MLIFQKISRRINKETSLPVVIYTSREIYSQRNARDAAIKASRVCMCAYTCVRVCYAIRQAIVPNRVYMRTDPLLSRAFSLRRFSPPTKGRRGEYEVSRDCQKADCTVCALAYVYASRVRVRRYAGRNARDNLVFPSRRLVTERLAAPRR